MVDRRKSSRWLDIKPLTGSTASRGARPDEWLTGVVTEILDGDVVAVSIDGSTGPDVVAPQVAGVIYEGARVRLLRDSTGRVSRVEAPGTLPDDAVRVYVGATGKAIELAELKSVQAVELSAAQAEHIQAVQDDLAAAQADLAVQKDYIDNTVTPGIAAAQDAADAAGETGEQAKADALAAMTKATTASGLVTVASVNPTSADASGKPVNAIWEVRSGATVLRRYVLTSPALGVWTQVQAGTAFFADMSVTSAKISDVTINKLSVTGGATMPTAVIDALVSDAAFLKAVYANRIVVAPENPVVNSTFTQGTKGWTLSAADVVTVADGPKGVSAPVLRITPVTSDLAAAINQGFPYNTADEANSYHPAVGTSWRVTMTVRLVSGTAGQIRVRGWISKGDNSSANRQWPLLTQDLKSSTATPGQWVTLEGTYTFPAGWSRFGFAVHALNAVGTVWEVGEVTLRPMVGSTEITPNAVTTEHVNATKELWAKVIAVAGDLTVGGRLLANGAVTARTLNIVPESGQGGMRMDAQGLDIIPADSDGDSAISLRADQDQWISFSKAKKVNFSVTAAGELTAQSVAANASLTYRGREVDTLIDPRPKGMQAHIRLDKSYNINTGTSRLMYVNLISRRDRMLRVSFTIHLNNANSGFYVTARATATSDIVTASNSIKRLWQLPKPAGANETYTIHEEFYIRGSEDVDLPEGQPYSLGIFIKALSGLPWVLYENDTNTPFTYTELTVEDVGVVPPLVTVPAFVGAAQGGGGGTGPDPGTTTTTYEKYLSPSAYGDYRGNGQPYNYFSGKVAQGLSPAGYGALHGLWVFPSLVSDLSGATVLDVQLYLENAHSYSNAGMNATLQSHGYGSLPSAYGGGTTFDTAAFAKGQARWLSAPSLAAGLKSGGIRGFGIYGSTTSEYGYFNGASAQLYVKYSK